MSIHKRIKDRREALGLTMEDLAAAIGVKAWQTVQQWEREDGTAPKRLRLEKVADVLGVSQEWLLLGVQRREGEHQEEGRASEPAGLSAGCLISTLCILPFL